MKADSCFITVAICTRNRLPLLRNAIDSVLPQLGDDAELLVVDNGSADGTQSFLTALAGANPKVAVTHEPRTGIAFARNGALRQARGRFVLFFDDDEQACPDWLESYRRFLHALPSDRIACVGGRTTAAFEESPPSWLDPRKFTIDFGDTVRCLPGPAFPGCGNCAYDRDRALAAGGFRTALERYEESDLDLRLRKAGFEIWWLPTACVRHRIPSSRVTVRHINSMAFADGISVGMMRLQAIRNPLLRMVYVWMRVGLSPLHCLLLLMVAGITVPIKGGQTSVKALERASRIFGQARCFAGMSLTAWRLPSTEKALTQS